MYSPCFVDRRKWYTWRSSTCKACAASQRLRLWCLPTYVRIRTVRVMMPRHTSPRATRLLTSRCSTAHTLQTRVEKLYSVHSFWVVSGHQWVTRTFMLMLRSHYISNKRFTLWSIWHTRPLFVFLKEVSHDTTQWRRVNTESFRRAIHLIMGGTNNIYAHSAYATIV